MANDKDFKVKNAVEVGGPTKVTLGTVTNNNIDLATGNYFADTPSGTSTYTISNAGDVQSFQLEVTGGTEEVAQNFSTTLYDGTGAEQTITNGIDLANDGGLLWIKTRSTTEDHFLFDTNSGNLQYLNSNTTDAHPNGSASNPYLGSFNNDGFSFTGGNAGAGGWNFSGRTYASWTFKKQANFFDVVTYTGNGSSQTIAHNLGSVPGTIMVKATSSTANWAVWHRTFTATQHIQLNTTSAPLTSATVWNSTLPTDSVFSVGNYFNTNSSGVTYVAYLFAHDTASDSLIKCGSFSTDSGSLMSVDLGWQPQWVMYKKTNSTGQWYIEDVKRSLSESSVGDTLIPNLSNAEGAGNGAILLTSTGFESKAAPNNLGASNDYIYIAIRAASDLDITWPSSIEWAGGVAPSAPATGETDVFTLSTDDGGTSYVGVKTADNLS